MEDDAGHELHVRLPDPEDDAKGGKKHAVLRLEGVPTDLESNIKVTDFIGYSGKRVEAIVRVMDSGRDTIYGFSPKDFVRIGNAKTKTPPEQWNEIKSDSSKSST